MSKIRTTLVGSYPVPAWVLNTPTRASLHDALKVVVKTQELAGLDVLVDGELGRFDVNHPETNGMIEYFLRPLAGLSTELTQAEIREFHAQEHMQFRSQPAAVVRGALGDGTLDLLSDYRRFAALTERPVKFTVTSPYMLAKTIFDQHYDSLYDLSIALAEVLAKAIRDIDADIIQVDEANLPGTPEDADWAFEPLNIVLNAIQGQSCLHLCFGNYGGQRIQSGFWADLMPFLNRLDVDALILEFARRGYDELAAFHELKPEIAMGIGVIDIKDLEIESPSTVAQRIELAVNCLGAERIGWVHPDCGFWMLPRNVADGKMQNLVQGRNLFYAEASKSLDTQEP